MRNIWLNLARRDPKSLSTKTRLYFSEDHFNIMLVLECAGAVLVAAVIYLHQRRARYRRCGVKGCGILAMIVDTLKVIIGWEHFGDIMKKDYYENFDERFLGTVLVGSPILLVKDVDLIKKITVKDFEHFIDHRNFAAGDPLFSRNLFVLKGNEWKDMRSNLSPAFTSSKMRQMVPFMVDVGNQMMLNLKKAIKENNSEYLEVNAKDLTTRYTNDVIASCAFGVKVDSHSERENEFYINGLETVALKVGRIILTTLSNAAPWLAKALKIRFLSESSGDYFKNLVLSTMDNREKNKIIRPDMIHLLMLAKKGKLENEEQSVDADTGFATVEESAAGKKRAHRVWTDEDLVAQALIFFLAGFDTVSTAMSFLLYELAINPDIQEKLYEEIIETDAKNDGKFDFNTILQMTYMDKVVSEVLRKWPPIVSLDRFCVKDYNMGKANPNATEDFIIRKGEGLQIPLWAIHRDPKYFPNPEKFDPERFSEENRNKINPFTYSPFGMGPRNCIGSRFALCEVKVMAYQLLQHMEVSPGPRTTITNQLDPAKFTVTIKGGHWVRFELRK